MKRLITIGILLFASVGVQADIAIIVNKSSSITSADATELERLYLGKSSTVGGAEVSAVNQKDTATVTEDFNRVVLNKSSSQVKAYWSKLVFTGKGSPPQELDNDAKVIETVKADAKAIGYIDAASVTSDVKVIMTLK